MRKNKGPKQFFEPFFFLLVVANANSKSSGKNTLGSWLDNLKPIALFFFHHFCFCFDRGGGENLKSYCVENLIALQMKVDTAKVLCPAIFSLSDKKKL